MPLKLGPDLRVLLVDANGAALAVGGGTQYADGATQANPTGNVFLWLDTSNVLRAASAAKPLPVAIISGAGGTVTDAAAWTTAVSSFVPGGGVFNDSATDLTAGQQGTLRMTAKRAQHMNLRNASAAEIGIAAAPLVVAGAKTNNNAAPGATNAGVLGGVANAAAPSWSEGNQVAFSADLLGAMRVIGPLDAGAWTTATSGFHPVGGVFNDSAAALTSGQQGTERLTAQRALHVNLRNNTGSESGVAALPLLVGGTTAGASPFVTNSIAIGFVGTGATHRNATAAPSVSNTTGTDILGVGNLVKGTTNFFNQKGDDSGNTTIVGTKTHNAAVPSTNLSTLPAVANAALPSWTETFEVKESVDLHGQQRVVAAGLTTVISTALTRPNNTTAYVAGQEMSNSTSAPTINTITGAARYSGGSGIIQGIYVSQTTLWTVKPAMEIWIYDTTSTPTNDGSAFAPTDGVTDTCIAVIPVTATYAGTVNQALDSGQISVPFLTVGSANLFFRVVIRNAAQDSAGSGVSTFRFRILND